MSCERKASLESCKISSMMDLRVWMVARGDRRADWVIPRLLLDLRTSAPLWLEAPKIRRGAQEKNVQKLLYAHCARKSPREPIFAGS